MLIQKQNQLANGQIYSFTDVIHKYFDTRFINLEVSNLAMPIRNDSQPYDDY